MENIKLKIPKIQFCILLPIIKTIQLSLMKIEEKMKELLMFPKNTK